VAAFFIESYEVLREYRLLMGDTGKERSSYSEHQHHHHSKLSTRRLKRKSIVPQQKAVSRWLGPREVAQKLLYKLQLKRKQKRSLAGLNYMSNHRKVAKVDLSAADSSQREDDIPLTNRVTIAQQVAEAYAAFQKEQQVLKMKSRGSSRTRVEGPTVASTDEASRHSASLYPSLNSLLNRSRSIALDSPSKADRLSYDYNDIYQDKESGDMHRLISGHADLFETLKREHVQLESPRSSIASSPTKATRDAVSPPKKRHDNDSPLKLHQSREAALAKVVQRRGDQEKRSQSMMLQQPSSDDDSSDRFHYADMLTPVGAPLMNHRDRNGDDRVDRDGDSSSSSLLSMDRRSEKRISIAEQVAAAYRQVSSGKVLPTAGVANLKWLAHSSDDSISTRSVSNVESTSNSSISIASQVATAYLQVDTGKRMFDQYKDASSSRHEISLLSLHKLAYDLGHYMSLTDITQSLSTFSIHGVMTSSSSSEGSSTIRYSDYINWWSRMEQISCYSLDDPELRRRKAAAQCFKRWDVTLSGYILSADFDALFAELVRRGLVDPLKVDLEESRAKLGLTSSSLVRRLRLNIFIRWLLSEDEDESIPPSDRYKCTEDAHCDPHHHQQQYQHYHHQHQQLLSSDRVLSRGRIPRVKHSPLVTVPEDDEEVEAKRYDEEAYLNCRHDVGTEKDDDGDNDDDNSTGMDSYVRNIHIDIDSTE